jgi:hypothetical protein
MNRRVELGNDAAVNYSIVIAKSERDEAIQYSSKGWIASSLSLCSDGAERRSECSSQL